MNQYDDNRDRPASAAPPPQGPPPQQKTQVGMPDTAPYVTYAIIAITVVMYVLQLASESMLGTDILILYGARINEAILAGELWRFITPALLHGSIPHILFNMYALFIFGTGLERHFGHGRFFLLYVLGAFTGNVISFLFSAGYSVGASTAVFGLLGAEAIFLYQNRKLFAGQFGRAIQNVIFIAAINLFLGLQPGIDNWGHVGGLLGGLMFTWFAGPLWEIEGIAPVLQLVDQRPSREVIVGAATVMLVFGALAMWGLTR
jgi:rhomboid protease GluP